MNDLLKKYKYLKDSNAKRKDYTTTTKNSRGNQNKIESNRTKGDKLRDKQEKSFYK